jgi:hypothetical protein
MERQPGICVIDLFGVSYDGTLPSIVFACDEVWFGLFAVAPPNPPDLESAARPDGRHSLSLSLFESRERIGQRSSKFQVQRFQFVSDFEH